VIGDERCVPPDHESSNSRMVSSTLFAEGSRGHTFLRFRPRSSILRRLPRPSKSSGAERRSARSTSLSSASERTGIPHHCFRHRRSFGARSHREGGQGREARLLAPDTDDARAARGASESRHGVRIEEADIISRLRAARASRSQRRRAETARPGGSSIATPIRNRSPDSAMKLLAADLGGTKTLVRALPPTDTTTTLREERLESAAYASFESLLACSSNRSRLG